MYTRDGVNALFWSHMQCPSTNLVSIRIDTARYRKAFFHSAASLITNPSVAKESTSTVFLSFFQLNSILTIRVLRLFNRSNNKLQSCRFSITSMPWDKEAIGGTERCALQTRRGSTSGDSDIVGCKEWILGLPYLGTSVSKKICEKDTLIVSVPAGIVIVLWT